MYGGKRTKLGMSDGEVLRHDHQLVEDILLLLPELENIYRPRGEVRDEVGRYIAGIFGHYWHVQTRDFGEAGKWRDYHLAAEVNISPLDRLETVRSVGALFTHTQTHIGEQGIAPAQRIRGVFNLG